MARQLTTTQPSRYSVATSSKPEESGQMPASRAATILRTLVVSWLLWGCGDSNRPVSNATTAPATCHRFSGKWLRPATGHVFEFVCDQDCNVLVTLPGDKFLHELRAKPVGDVLAGAMLRQDRTSACAVHLEIKFTLLDQTHMREEILGVQGQCDIGPDYREDFPLQRLGE